MSASGMVQTVLGPVSPDDLGLVLPHEHLLIDLRPRFLEPDGAEERELARQPVTLANLAWVRRNWAASLDNLVLDDVDLAIAEVRRFARAGGGTIVDAGSVGIRPDPMALRRIAEASGVHVVAATGYYTQEFHPAAVATQPAASLVEAMVRDLREGIGGTAIRAGIIGEVGCSWPIHPDERRVLGAAARAQRETGVAISIHPGRHPGAPFEILAILEEAGADLGRVVMGHLERAEMPEEGLVRLAASGCYMELDWFGEVQSLHPMGPLEVPSDIQRIDWIRRLMDAGHGDRILASHDVCLKTRLAAYGGVGYAHLPASVRPWMLARGMSRAEVDLVLVHNPQRMLAVA